MYWAIATDRVDRRGLECEQVLADIQTLNQWARAARLEVTALSLAAYPFVQEDYALLPHGASIGSGYGPSSSRRDRSHTTSSLSSRSSCRALSRPRSSRSGSCWATFGYRELAFEEIPDEVASGRADAGLVIHEGQLTFESFGLAKVLDLGEWWLLETGLPLPLGVNAARRDLGPEVLHNVSEVLREAIRCALDNRAEALEYAVQFGRGIDAAVADRFVAMYVNELTQDYGQEGRQAVTEFLRRGEAIGAFPAPVQVDFVS